ncbi:hypothetical protein TNCV_4599801 [Trichonephila clavipes]|nr:hypothetical protein TNCV_4599801 [Trichonephila clavipes]
MLENSPMKLTYWIILSSPRHVIEFEVRRRNVNFDYETRGEPIDDPTLKYKADTLDKVINALESRYKRAGPGRRDTSGFVALLNKKEKSNRDFKIQIEPGFCSKSRYSFKVAAGSTGHCTPECVVYARWGINLFFDCSVKPPPRYISREVDCTRRTCCLASTLPGPKSIGFFLLGPPEITPVATVEDLMAWIVVTSADIVSTLDSPTILHPPVLTISDVQL